MRTPAAAFLLRRSRPTCSPSVSPSLVRGRASFSCATAVTATKGDDNNMRQLEALIGRLDEMRAANQRPKDRSSRTPTTIYTQNNAADQLERQLRADGHRIWGFVIYRCTYADDTAWRECIEHIRASLRNAMDLYNGHDLLEEGRFALTVIEDASTLDGASSVVVRQHFDDWCARMAREEQGSEDEIAARREEASPYDSLLSQRYRFCTQIDDACLQSVNSQGSKGWIKLLKRDWQPEEEASATDEGDFTDDEEDDDEYPTIEGCRDHDVGWMKVRLSSVMPDKYVDLRDADAWYTSYIRPPDVATR